MHDRVLELAAGEYAAELCHSWPDKYPDYVTLKHPVNHKWFGLVAVVPGRFIGLDDVERVDILNVKADPMLVLGLVKQEGYHPAYHMNKEHWITVRLDGSVPFDQVAGLLDASYSLVAPKRRR